MANASKGYAGICTGMHGITIKQLHNEKKCDERVLGAYKALRIHKGGCLKTRVVVGKGTTLHADAKVLLLRILKDGRGNLSQGIRNYQSVVRSANKRRKDYTTDTTGLL